MATLNGFCKTSDYEGRFLLFEWSASQNTTNNTSTINWTLKGAGTGESSWYNAAPFKVVINGAVVYESNTRVQLAEGTLVAKGSKAITHNADGSKTLTVSIQGAIYQQTYNVSGSGSWVLTPIPKKATILTAPSFNDDSNPTITYTNPLGNTVTSLQACIADGSNTNILVPYRDITKTGSSYTFNLTSTERSSLRNYLSNANSGTVRFYIRTILNGTNYYSYLAKTLTITSGAPYITPIYADNGTDLGGGLNTLQLTGDEKTIIRHLSNVEWQDGAVAQKQAKITSTKMTCGTYSSTAGSGVIPKIETNVMKFTVTDSRGKSNTHTETIPSNLFIPYVPLTCNLKASAPTTSGVATLRINGNCYQGSFGAVNNVCYIFYRYKENDGDYTEWQAVTTPTRSASTYSVEIPVPDLNYLNSYTFEAKAMDSVTTVTSKSVKVKTTPVFDWGESDFNFNVPVRMKSGMAIQGVATDGSAKNMMYLNSADNVTIGGGAYPPKHILLSTEDNGGNIYLNGRVYGTNKVLWSGGVYMQDGQSISLSEPISKQPNGIVLVFSRYSPATSTTEATVHNHNFSYHFVPKIMLNYLANGGSTFNMSTNAQELFASKYLYFSDESISGHANNIASGTGANGIKYSNNMFVLRYVIGV